MHPLSSTINCRLKILTGNVAKYVESTGFLKPDVPF